MKDFKKTDWIRLSMTTITVIGMGLYGASTARAATIFLNLDLNNASFEAPVSTGLPPVSCPTSWTCSGSPAPGFGAYTVTSAQYTPGSDGLSGGAVVPDGTQAGFSPTTIEGSGDLFQTTGLTYVAGDTYMISFWVGLPNSEPGGPVSCGIPSVSCVVNAFPNTVEFNFTSGASIALNGLPGPYVISSPGQGQWELVTESFTAAPTAAYIGTTVGVDFHVATTANNQAVNFDMSTSSVPEPGSAAMLGVGLALTGLSFWKRRARR